jgi:hypothetical protein
VKNWKKVIFSNFRVDIQLFLNPRNFCKYQIRIPRTFLPQKGSFFGKNPIFSTFRFNTQAFPESEKHFFSLRKCQIRISRMFLSLEVSFFRKKLSKVFNFFMPYLIGDSFLFFFSRTSHQSLIY